MRGIKDIILASNKLSIKAAKYIVTNSYKSGKITTFLAEDESEVTDAFYDWGFENSEVDFLDRKIQNLKPNQSYLHARDYNDWVLITCVDVKNYYL